jgi:hypothetical protein
MRYTLTKLAIECKFMTYHFLVRAKPTCYSQPLRARMGALLPSPTISACHRFPRSPCLCPPYSIRDMDDKYDQIQTPPSAVCRPSFHMIYISMRKYRLPCLAIPKTVNVMLIMYASNAFATIAGVSYVRVSR